MSFRINYNDSKKTKILKLFYLIPFGIVSYIPAVIYCGIKEVGKPFAGLSDILKDSK